MNRRKYGVINVSSLLHPHACPAIKTVHARASSKIEPFYFFHIRAAGSLA